MLSCPRRARAGDRVQPGSASRQGSPGPRAHPLPAGGRPQQLEPGPGSEVHKRGDPACNHLGAPVSSSQQRGDDGTCSSCQGEGRLRFRCTGLGEGTTALLGSLAAEGTAQTSPPPAARCVKLGTARTARCSARRKTKFFHVSGNLLWHTVGSVNTKELTDTSSIALSDTRGNHQPRRAVEHLQRHCWALSGGNGPHTLHFW